MLSEIRRFYQDEFNRFRTLVELGKRISLIKDLLSEKEYNEVLSRYKEGNVIWLNVWFRKKSNNELKREKFNFKRN